MTNQIIGAWRIIETDVWAQDALDLVAAARLRFKRDGCGDLRMIALQADVDYRVGERGPDSCDFSFVGEDEGMPICGRAWATISGDRMEGRILLHRGDEARFVAIRSNGDDM